MAISATTAATVTAIVSMAGAAVSAYGIIQQQQAASAQAKREAKNAEMQGQMARENALMQAAEKQKEAQRTAASQVVAGAGAGITLDSTSLMDLMEETKGLYESDIDQLKRTGNLQYAAGQYNAAGFKLGAKRGPSYFRAGATLLQGIGTGISYGNKAGWFD